MTGTVLSWWLYTADLTLLGRQEILLEKVGPRITVRSTLITTYGLTQNEFSGVFTNVITLDDLFAD